MLTQKRERRDLNIGTAAQGGHFKATDLDAASFIDLLRNRMVVVAAGATVIGDLRGDLDIPRQTGASTASWVAENGSATESTPAVDKVKVKPKTSGLKKPGCIMRTHGLPASVIFRRKSRKSKTAGYPQPPAMLV